jgi:hypothetical protein
VPVLHPEVQKRYGHVIAIFIQNEEIESMTIDIAILKSMAPPRGM